MLAAPGREARCATMGLCGTWENPGVEKTYVSITLFPREPDED